MARPTKDAQKRDVRFPARITRQDLSAIDGLRHSDESANDSLLRLMRGGYKQLATRLYKKALRDGVLLPADECERCGAADTVIHGHHPDYGRPLDVEWLCASCHSKEHFAIETQEGGASRRGPKRLPHWTDPLRLPARKAYDARQGNPKHSTMRRWCEERPGVEIVISAEGTKVILAPSAVVISAEGTKVLLPESAE